MQNSMVLSVPGQDDRPTEKCCILFGTTNVHIMSFKDMKCDAYSLEN